MCTHTTLACCSLTENLNAWKVELYSAFSLSLDAMANFIGMHQRSVSQRPARKAKKKKDDTTCENLGYQSFKRGDLVRWDGEQDHEDEVVEVVYANMVFYHRNQQRRYLITYERKLDKFSIGTWTSWALVPNPSGNRVYMRAMQL